MRNPEESKTTVTRWKFKAASPYGGEHPATIKDLLDAVQIATARLDNVKGQRYAQSDDGLLWYVDDNGIVLYFDVETAAL